MPTLLLRAGLVEPRAGEEGRPSGAIARTARRGGWRSRSRSSLRRLPRWSRRRRLSELLVEGSQHAGGLFPAGHAQIQPFFRLGEDGVGIVFAVVSALPAILLCHRRHHAATKG